jgi:hypothetical protein
VKNITTSAGMSPTCSIRNPKATSEMVSISSGNQPHDPCTRSPDLRPRKSVTSPKAMRIPLRTRGKYPGPIFSRVPKGYESAM